MGERDTSLVAVALTDDRIEMPVTIQAGQTNFIVQNQGRHAHSFQIEGHGIEEAFDSSLSPGEIRTLKISLPPGSYNACCPLDNDHGTPVHLQVRDPRKSA